MSEMKLNWPFLRPWHAAHLIHLFTGSQINPLYNIGVLTPAIRENRCQSGERTNTICFAPSLANATVEIQTTQFAWCKKGNESCRLMNCTPPFQASFVENMFFGYFCDVSYASFSNYCCQWSGKPLNSACVHNCSWNVTSMFMRKRAERKGK